MKRLGRLGLTTTALAAMMVSATALVEVASAAPSVSCGQVVTTDITLLKDVGPCPADGIIVGADDVTVNLNGHRLLGQDLKTGNHAGIRLPNRHGVAVIGGKPGASISGFDAGVLINGGSGNKVKNLTVRDNGGAIPPAALLSDGIILFDSAGNTMQNLVVDHNGFYDGIGILGIAANSNIVKANTVINTVAYVTPPEEFSNAGNGTGVGVIIDASPLSGANEGKLIRGNMVLGNVVRSNQGSGIANVNTADGVIAGNTVEDNGTVQVPGNGIGMHMGFFPETHVTRMVVQGNVVRRNGNDGIYSYEEEQNRIVDNLVEDNGFGTNPRITTHAGIYVGATIGGQNIVRGNTVRHNRYHGINLEAFENHTYGRTYDNYIENNVVTDSANMGILFSYRGDDVRNYIRSNYVVNSGSGSDYGDVVDGGTLFFEVLNCAQNVYDDNTYEFGNPACATAGGHQVSVAPAAATTQGLSASTSAFGRPSRAPSAAARHRPNN